MSGLCGCAAKHLDRRTGRHARCRAGFRLAATFGTAERRAFRHHRADQSCCRERIDDLFVGNVLRERDTGQHCGQHTGTARRRRCDDHAHAGVDLLHGECAHQHIAEQRARQRTRWSRDHLRGVAAHESRLGAQGRILTLRDRAAHDVQGACQRVADVRDGAPAVGGFGLERDGGE